ncbi:MAG: hypothetical protein PUE04_03490 [Lachnospira sp.]|nr:hypothetical protein [Lachnospira sp.]
MSQEEFLQELRYPGDDYSAVPFWFFNDAFDPEKVRTQLSDIKHKGVSAFVLHPRIGIPEDTPYLSERFFCAMRYIVHTAASLGMKVCLYDEGMYPSGSAHGEVVARNPAWAARGLCVAKAPGRGPGDETIAALPDGRFLVYTFTGGTIRGIHFGEDDGENPPPAADLLNPDAVAAFIHLTHDRYYRELKAYFGTTIFAFFTDEPDPVGRNAAAFRPWAPGLEQEILAQGGNLAELAGLFGGKTNPTVRIYTRLIKQRLRETFYRPLSEWCAAHGIALMGHPAASDDVEEEFCFQIPGQDLIQRRIEPKKGGIRGMESVQAKLAADIARALGRERSASECFGVCCRNGWPWYMTAEDMKWYTDWLGMRGCSLFVPHAFFYSVRDGADGKRSAERPPDVGPHNIWWEHYRAFAVYFRRLSWLNTGNVSGARIAVPCAGQEVPYEEVAELYRAQIGFQYLPVRLPCRLSVEDGRLSVSGQEFDAVFDPLDLLSREMPSGGLPAGNGKIAVLKTAEQVLQAAQDHPSWRAVSTRTPQPDLRAVRFRKMGVDCVLLGNDGGSTIRTEIRILGAQKADVLTAADLWRGRAWALPAPGGEAHIVLPPDSTLLLLTGGAPEGLACAACPDPEKLPDWTGRFQEDKEAAGENKKVYTLVLTPEEIREAVFRLTAEEMCKLYEDGRLLGVSFWNPHVFDLRGLRSGGDLHTLRLIVTGNAANLYTASRVPFGLGVDNKDGSGLL